jgi:Cys-tRNA(Pro)/Cys-tRNA(Cys) deacylase
MTPGVVQLERAKVVHRVVTYDHDPAAASYGREAAEAIGVEPGVVFKTLLASLDGTKLVVAIVPVDSMLDLKALARAAGAKKAEMADPKAAERSTGYVVGGISPFGQRKRLATYLDVSAVDHPEIYVSGGRRGVEIALAAIDLVAVLDATVAALAV